MASLQIRGFQQWKLELILIQKLQLYIPVTEKRGWSFLGFLIFIFNFILPISLVGIRFHQEEPSTVNSTSCLALSSRVCAPRTE